MTPQGVTLQAGWQGKISRQRDWPDARQFGDGRHSGLPAAPPPSTLYVELFPVFGLNWKPTATVSMTLCQRMNLFLVPVVVVRDDDRVCVARSSSPTCVVSQMAVSPADGRRSTTAKPKHLAPHPLITRNARTGSRQVRYCRESRCSRLVLPTAGDPLRLIAPGCDAARSCRTGRSRLYGSACFARLPQPGLRLTREPRGAFFTQRSSPWTRIDHGVVAVDLRTPGFPKPPKERIELRRSCLLSAQGRAREQAVVMNRGTVLRSSEGRSAVATEPGWPRRWMTSKVRSPTTMASK